MKAAAVLLLAVAGLGAAPAAPAPPDRCAVPEGVAAVEASLPRVAERVRSGQPVRIVVIGTASSAGSGTSGDKGYAQRVGQALARKLPVPVEVQVLAKRGWTAAAMVDEIEGRVAATKPDLVVWQTGTVEAVREVDRDAFATALGVGAAALKRAGSDIVLVDMQFAPMAGLLIDYGPYRETMGWIATATGIQVFPRYAIMQAWSEDQRFPEPGRDKAAQRAYADAIHGCLAERLAVYIREAVDAADAQ